MSDPARQTRISSARLKRRCTVRRRTSAGPRTPTAATALASRSRLTEVELAWIEKKLEHWIRFGRIAQERILTRRTRVVSFRPDAIFAFVRWTANDYGTITSRIDVVRAVDAEAYTTLPFVQPGGRDPPAHRELAEGPAGARRDRRGGEAAGVDPCDAAADHWRHVHNLHRCRPSAPVLHAGAACWLKRREIEGMTHATAMSS